MFIEMKMLKAKDHDECYRLVTTEIENIWHKFSFPTIKTEGVFSKVCRLMEKASNLNKTSRLRRNANFYDKLKAFDNMFDICSCNCYDLGVEREKCRCTFKVPIKKWDAFVGQKKRTNQLGLLDCTYTSTLKKTEKRKKKQLNTHTNVEKDTDRQITDDNFYESEDNIILDESNNEYDKLYESNVFKKCNQNRFHYNELAIIADRYRVSCRATAAIVNAALKDMGILNESNMLDRKKVERERLHVGQKKCK